MENLNITEKELKSGITLEIDTFDKEDLRTATLEFSEKLNKFLIWFNGKLIHSSITFSSLKNRLKKLNENFPLDIMDSKKSTEEDI